MFTEKNIESSEEYFKDFNYGDMKEEISKEISFRINSIKENIPIFKKNINKILKINNSFFGKIAKKKIRIFKKKIDMWNN